MKTQQLKDGNYFRCGWAVGCSSAEDKEGETTDYKMRVFT